MRDRAWWIVLALVGGCVDPSATACGDGTFCPANHVCTANGQCATPDQIQACATASEGDPCSVPSGGVGVCLGGICAGVDCGDTIVAIE